MVSGLRIAFITPEYVSENYFSGGLANYIYRVSKALVDFGHEVHVVTLSETENGKLFHHGIGVHRVKVGQIQCWLNRFTGYRLRGVSRWLDFSFQVYRKLRELQRESPFDIIQFPNSHYCGLISSVFLPTPYTVRISCYRPVWRELSGAPLNLDARVREWLEWLQLRLCRHIYAPSYILQRMLAEKANVQGVHLIRTPFFLENIELDPSLFEAHLKEKNYLMFFGRFQLHKGFHILAQALPHVLETYPECHAVFVGLDMPSRLAASMKDYALSLCGKNAERLIFFGQTRHQQLYPIIAGAKLVVLPSLIDNLPNACLEAMALGKSVVATYGASFEEIITDGETGFLVTPGDSEALAKKINEVWTHPRLQEVGEAARQTVLAFAPECTVRDLLEYYREILDGNN